ncbi:MAG: two-component system response regulator, partial [Lachnospiraceae bacterium]|nr:two-component system response regulator [Lachnospiraceae bacterium]
VSLVDVYDALTTKRVYKYAYDQDKAYQMILNGQSGSFSAKLLKAFAEVRPDLERLLAAYPDEEE